MSNEGGVFYAPETFRRKLTRWFGFGWGHADRPDIAELEPEWAPSWFMVETYIHLDFLDRLRLLASGKLHVQQAVKTDKTILRSQATSGIGILPPGAKMGKPG